MGRNRLRHYPTCYEEGLIRWVEKDHTPTPDSKRFLIWRCGSVQLSLQQNCALCNRCLH
jgi:hypothetical protein